MTAFSIIITILIGYTAAAAGDLFMNGFRELGSIVAIAIMGGIILAELKKK